MPDESPSGLVAHTLQARATGAWRRFRQWLRRGYDAELLELLPESGLGDPLTIRSFAHPVNRSPLWWYVRPYVWGVALPLLLIPLLATLRVTVRPSDFEFVRPPLLAFLFAGHLQLSFTAWLARKMFRRRWERMARETHRAYLWRATTALDSAIRDALERERTPTRLRDLPGSWPPA